MGRRVRPRFIDQFEVEAIHRGRPGPFRGVAVRRRRARLSAGKASRRGGLAGGARQVVWRSGATASHGCGRLEGGLGGDQPVSGPAQLPRRRLDGGSGSSSPDRPHPDLGRAPFSSVPRPGWGPVHGASRGWVWEPPLSSPTHTRTDFKAVMRYFRPAPGSPSRGPKWGVSLSGSRRRRTLDLAGRGHRGRPLPSGQPPLARPRAGLAGGTARSSQR